LFIAFAASLRFKSKIPFKKEDPEREKSGLFSISLLLPGTANQLGFEIIVVP